MSTSHELGHSLGLSHSDVKSSLLAPFYRGYEKNDMDIDDIREIQELYGVKVTDNRNDNRNKVKLTMPRINPAIPFPISSSTILKQKWITKNCARGAVS